MRTLHWTLSALCLSIVTASAAVPIPGDEQRETIIIENATIHTVSDQVIERGSISFRDGKIIFVGRGNPLPQGTSVLEIDGTGKHVYPSLIQSHSRLGLEEIGAVRATRDYAEVGEITPNVRTQVAFNPESEVIPVNRANGVLLTVVAPEGRLLQGLSSLMMMDGWTWDDMALEPTVGLHVVWPAMGIARGPRVRLPEEQQIENREKALARLDQAFEDAKAYAAAREAAGSSGLPEHRIDARWEAMIPVLQKEIPVIVSAMEIRQIQAAVAFAQRHDVRLILLGGYDAPLAADLLRENGVPVIIDGVHRLPARRSDPYDHPFTLANRLLRQRVSFAITAAGRPINERNLPYQAATAAAYGLPPREALRAITLSAAEILGVDDRVGSLDVGKDATLFIADGDILEIPTQVERAFIQGREVDLTNKQSVLYAKYREKYRRLGLIEE